MATESKIRISVDDSELNKLRQQAENLARDMIRASREFATGGDEVIADLEEQIRLMERQHRIAEEYARTEIERAEKGRTNHSPASAAESSTSQCRCCQQSNFSGSCS